MIIRLYSFRKFANQHQSTPAKTVWTLASFRIRAVVKENILLFKRTLTCFSQYLKTIILPFLLVASVWKNSYSHTSALRIRDCVKRRVHVVFPTKSSLLTSLIGCFALPNFCEWSPWLKLKCFGGIYWLGLTIQTMI